MAGRQWPAYSGISPTPHQLQRKKIVKVGPPLTTFSGSAHEGAITKTFRLVWDFLAC